MPIAHQKKKKAPRRPPRFELMGGPACLDFVNTLDDRFTNEPKELLKSYVDLARFAEDTGILDAMEVDRLFQLSQQSPEASQRVLAAAIQLREAIYAIFWAVLTRKPVPAAALFTLNQYVQVAAQHARLVAGSGRLDWGFEEARGNLEAPLWPIARSAGDLLASDDVRFVRACASKTCLWLFLDTSKAHRRRWCDMTKCGNRAKFRRFYARKRRSS